MAMMKRTYTAIFAILALALALPAVAPATLAEVGVIPPTTSPETVPSCPASPCLAVSRTTGFQLKVGTNTTLMTVPRSGSIVAWTIMLGKPNATQIKFFNANEGGAAEAGIAILRAQKPKLTYKLIASSPPVKLRSISARRPSSRSNDDRREKGRHRRHDRPDLGARARAGLRQGHLVARQPRQAPVREHERAEHAARRSAARCSTTASTRPRA